MRVGRRLVTITELPTVETLLFPLDLQFVIECFCAYSDTSERRGKFAKRAASRCAFLSLPKRR